MSIVSIIAIFFVVWWIVLFAVLPWGMRTQDDEGEVILGTVSSAPHNPKLVRKAITTTVVAALVTLVIWFVVDQLGFDVEGIADFFQPRP